MLPQADFQIFRLPNEILIGRRAVDDINSMHIGVGTITKTTELLMENKQDLSEWSYRLGRSKNLGDWFGMG